MNTTYLVNWQAGDEPPLEGRLEVTQEAVAFAPQGGGDRAEVPFSCITAVRRCGSVVEIDRRSGAQVLVESIAAEALGSRLEAAFGRSELLRSLRAEHDRIAAELGRLRAAIERPSGSGDAYASDVDALATLVRHIARHVRAEERELYPAVDRLLGCRPLVEAMRFDHRAIEGELHELGRADTAEHGRLGAVFQRLDALLTTHIAKEEAIVFPLLESRRVCSPRPCEPAPGPAATQSGRPSAATASSSVAWTLREM